MAPDRSGWYPGNTEIGVNVAGQRVLRLHDRPGAGIVGIFGDGALGGGELGADSAGAIGMDS